jgi:soluble lytic murein transglycosylase-like protein
MLRRIGSAWIAAALALATIACILWSSPTAAQVPKACEQYRAELSRSAYRILGPSAPVATQAAHIEQESGCNRDAVSWAGAQGLAQFMPATAADMARLHSECSPANPFDPRWAFACRDRYMRSLIASQRPMSGKAVATCDAFAFALKSYNGGLGWVNRDRRLTAERGGNADDWLTVNTHNAGRKPSAFNENAGYVPHILRRQEKYISAGWGDGICR